MLAALQRAIRRRRSLSPVLGSIAAMAAGFGLLLASFVPDIAPSGSTTLNGSVPASSTHNESFRSDAGLAEIRLEMGGCSVFVTLLNQLELDAYIASGDLPGAQLDCDRRVATFSYPLRWILIENAGPTMQNYTVTGAFFSVQFSRAVLALPALSLILVGGLYLTLWGFRRSVERFRDGHEKGRKR